MLMANLPCDQVKHLFLSVSQLRGPYFPQHKQNQVLFIPTTTSGPASFISAWALPYLPAGPHVLYSWSILNKVVRMVLLTPKLGYSPSGLNPILLSMKVNVLAMAQYDQIFLLVILGCLLNTEPIPYAWTAHPSNSRVAHSFLHIFAQGSHHDHLPHVALFFLYFLLIHYIFTYICV